MSILNNVVLVIYSELNIYNFFQNEFNFRIPIPKLRGTLLTTRFITNLEFPFNIKNCTVFV